MSLAKRIPSLSGGILAILLPAALAAQPRTAAGTDSLRDGPLIWLESLGGSTGDVMKIHVVNPGSDPIVLDGRFAVEPVDLSPAERDRIFASVKEAAGNHVEAVVSFYCLEFGAAAPPPGVVYRIAPRAEQVAFQPAAKVMEAARRLQEAGELSPDTSPEPYFHSIRQWSVWTLQEGFDRDGFIAAFLEHTRKNVEAGGVEWSDAVAAAVLRSAEGRWRDIAKIVESADNEGRGQ